MSSEQGQGKNKQMFVVNKSDGNYLPAGTQKLVDTVYTVY